MSGYILEYYQYIRYTEWSKKMLTEYLNKRMSVEDKGLLTFGEFDRLRIKKVQEFSRFRDVSEMSRKWAGKKTQVLLYDVVDEPTIYFNTENEKFEIDRSKNMYPDGESPLFLGVTIMPIEDSVRKNKDYEEIVKGCRSQLQDVTIELEKDKSTYFEVFGTLGTYGVAVIWLTDQYVDVLEILNALLKKQREKNIYFALNTLFSENLREEEIENARERIGRIKDVLVFVLRQTRIKSYL